MLGHGDGSLPSFLLGLSRLPTFLLCPSVRMENSRTVVATASLLRHSPQTPGLASRIHGEKECFLSQRVTFRYIQLWA